MDQDTSGNLVQGNIIGADPTGKSVVVRLFDQSASAKQIRDDLKISLASCSSTLGTRLANSAAQRQDLGAQL